MRRAIDLLPPEIKPFFIANADEIVVRVTDPDLWRTVGWDDDANHFVELRRTGTRGVSRFRRCRASTAPRWRNSAPPTLKRLGTLPWREEEESGNLRRAMEGFKKNQPFAISHTMLFASVASHYLQDACQPLHASNNFDGQLTRQNGVHARFETGCSNDFSRG